MKHVLLLVVTFFSLELAAQSSEKQQVQLINMEPFHIDVDVATAKNMVKIQGDNLVFLDVRTPEEVKVGKINGAIEMDFRNPDFDQKLAALDKTKQYMIYCYAGGLSEKVMVKMKELGFKQVYNLEHGYRSWREASQNTNTK
jgi:rhodanese-related sulfurtransferase